MVVSHLITCSWFFIASQNPTDILEQKTFWAPLPYLYTNKDKDNSVDFHDDGQTDNAIQYAFTLYSIIQVVLGGEVAPVTAKQNIILVVLIVIYQITLISLFADILILRRKYLEQENKYWNQRNKILQLISRSRYFDPATKKELRSSIVEYFDFCWSKKLIFKNDLCNFNELSKTLINDCQLVKHKDTLTNVPLFSRIELNELSWIVNNMKTQIYLPYDILYFINEKLNGLTLILSGVVEQSQYFSGLN